MRNTLHIYINNKLRNRFSEYCDKRGWKMSTVLQKVIEMILTGEIDPFKEKETK